MIGDTIESLILVGIFVGLPLAMLVLTIWAVAS